MRSSTEAITHRINHILLASFKYCWKIKATILNMANAAEMQQKFLRNAAAARQ